MLSVCFFSQVGNPPSFWMWNLGMMRLTWRNWRRPFPASKCQTSFGEHVCYFMLFDSCRTLSLIANLFTFELTCFFGCSKTCFCSLWHKEIADHNDYCGWSCVRWYPRWRASYSGTRQQIHSKLWYCCIQPDLEESAICALVLQF